MALDGQRLERSGFGIGEGCRNAPDRGLGYGFVAYRQLQKR